MSNEKFWPTDQAIVDFFDSIEGITHRKLLATSQWLNGFSYISKRKEKKKIGEAYLNSRKIKVLQMKIHILSLMADLNKWASAPEDVKIRLEEILKELG